MHSCSALIVSCIDFRIQPAVEDWARRNLGPKNYDRAAGTEAIHRQNLLSAAATVKSKYSDLNVETYFIMLSGEFR